MKDQKHSNISALSADEEPHKIDEQSSHGLRTRVAGMQTHPRVLGGFSPLTQIAFAHIIKDLGPHFGPPKICGHLMICFSSTQMARKNCVMQVFIEHASQRNWDNPMTSPCFLGEVTQKAFVNLEFTRATPARLNFFPKIST